MPVASYHEKRAEVMKELDKQLDIKAPILDPMMKRFIERIAETNEYRRAALGRSHQKQLFIGYGAGWTDLAGYVAAALKEQVPFASNLAAYLKPQYPELADDAVLGMAVAILSGEAASLVTEAEPVKPKRSHKKKVVAVEE